MNVHLSLSTFFIHYFYSYTNILILTPLIPIPSSPYFHSDFPPSQFKWYIFIKMNQELLRKTIVKEKSVRKNSSLTCRDSIAWLSICLIKKQLDQWLVPEF